MNQGLGSKGNEFKISAASYRFEVSAEIGVLLARNSAAHPGVRRVVETRVL